MRDIFAPAPPLVPDTSLETRLRFERYLVDLAARFLNLPAEAVAGELDASLETLLDVLGIDRCSICIVSGSSQELPVRYSVARPGVPKQLLVDLAPLLPWYARQLLGGQRLVLRQLPEDLPPEATPEREYVVQAGLKSHVALPMKAGGEVVGVLGLSTLLSHRGWEPDFLSRLDVLAGIFASALYRRAAEARLRAAEDLNRSVLASLPDEVIAVDAAGHILTCNEAWAREAEGDERHGVAAGGEFGTSGDCAAHGGCAAEQLAGVRAVIEGERPRYESRCQHAGANGPRAYFLTATPLRGEQKGAVVVHTDVTELAETKAALEASLRQVEELKARVEAENVLLRQEVHRAGGFDEIVGTSAALGRVLAQVEQVAPTDAPVLLLGETGTGKDLVAHALHLRSSRRERPIVTVNCAALPATLVESELFGYEKGAFTGALQRTIGRFEVADGGTLFLDEIGELPHALQAKLLRVLQSGEFERLGSPRTIKVDVRLIAATNRDLEHAMREGTFRSDLYYRLSVFPLTLPPLRDRVEDIPLIVWHFIARRQAKLGRVIKHVPERLMRAFSAYPWPGNVRELENVVERALIMTSGTTLAADPAFLDGAPLPLPAIAASASLAEAERTHIRAVLEECGWKVSGKGNAAERLGLNRSTLQFRMHKLGLKRPDA